MRHLFLILMLMLNIFRASANDYVGLTLIPPGKVTDKVNLDIRAGIVNHGGRDCHYTVTVYWDKTSRDAVLLEKKIMLTPGKSEILKVVVPTEGKAGKHKVILDVREGKNKYRKVSITEIVKSDIRSTRQISGAWTSLYHWSEIEGKHWNSTLRTVTEKQWKELVRAMHKVEMDMAVIQEVFRNEEYVGKHHTTADNYKGKAFYPSQLYPMRMDIVCEDPVEAILEEADRNDMAVMIGVGLFAWFDFTPESLEWHERVARELWQRYGHHKSFYAFYISEESGGGLDNWEQAPEMRKKRKDDIVEFFKSFKAFCSDFAPDKPVMLATNSFDVRQGADTYPRLLEHLDILCPFGFARMPQNDMTGKEASAMLQDICDKAGAHLWFDLETFLFNDDNSLYPRPIDQIITDLNMFDNFEKILCYQFPGVFNSPKMSVRIGEERTIELYEKYSEYLRHLKKKR